MGWSISENLEPVYHDDPRESIGNYLAVDAESGTIVDARNIILVRYDVFDGDVAEGLSDREIVELAERTGFRLDDGIVN